MLRFLHAQPLLHDELAELLILAQGLALVGAHVEEEVPLQDLALDDQFDELAGGEGTVVHPILDCHPAGRVVLEESFHQPFEIPGSLAGTECAGRGWQGLFGASLRCCRRLVLGHRRRDWWRLGGRGWRWWYTATLDWNRRGRLGYRPFRRLSHQRATGGRVRFLARGSLLRRAKGGGDVDIDLDINVEITRVCLRGSGNQRQQRLCDL